MIPQTGTIEPYLTIIIPAHNEAGRLCATLERVIGFLDGRWICEIIVVDNASVDGTSDIARKFIPRIFRPNSLRVMRIEEKGKGATVKHGMLCAKGQFCIFTDADLSTPIEEIARLVLLLEAGHDVVIGSRELADSNVTIKQSTVRRNMGKIFNRIIKGLGLTSFKDTQCGFKGFHKEAVRRIFPKLSTTGFAFDVEVLLLAVEENMSIVELPVTWTNNSDSKVHIIWGPIAMFVEVIWIFLRKMRKT